MTVTPGASYTLSGTLFSTKIDKWVLIKVAYNTDTMLDGRWIQLKEGATALDVYNWVEEHKLNVKKYENRELDLQSTMSDPLLQGTNGVLTMGFVVTIVLCAVGYLIYWVMSIRERELIFGVLRATGFHKGEIFHMLLNEQVFSGVFSIFAGKDTNLFANSQKLSQKSVCQCV